MTESKAGPVLHTERLTLTPWEATEDMAVALYAYQLMPEVFNRLGIHDGTLMLYHQNHAGDEDYLKNLKMLEYDMLYGKRYIYGGTAPFETVDMKMGIRPIKIEEVVQIGYALPFYSI